MKANHSSVFLEVIERLSKSTAISEGDVEGISEAILLKATELLNIPRVNVWLMKEDDTGMYNLLAYNAIDKRMYNEPEILQSEYPVYFEHIGKNDIIVSSKTQNEPFNKELLTSYLIPLNIQSMMEVPILSAGKLKGIVCFEHIGTNRKWTNDEQHFAIALAQLLTITYETNAKNNYRIELEIALKEKSLLLAELNHRVKNNLSIITALVRSETNRVKDNYHKSLFDNILSKTYSLATLQDELYQSQSYKSLNFGKFIEQLANNLNRTFGNDLNVKISISSTEPMILDVDTAMPLSLICSEIFTNCFKYAFKENGINKISIFLGKDQDGKNFLSVDDNGVGLPDNYATKGTGFELMHDLAEQIDAEFECLSSSTGTQISLKF